MKPNSVCKSAKCGVRCAKFAKCGVGGGEMVLTAIAVASIMMHETIAEIIS